jgi:hypothetical protein
MPFSGRICPIFGIPENEFDFSPLQSILELKRETNNFSKGDDYDDYNAHCEKRIPGADCRDYRGWNGCRAFSHCSGYSAGNGFDGPPVGISARLIATKGFNDYDVYSEKSKGF